MMEADRILFVASAIHTQPEPLTYPERLRLCIELERIALVVRRMERQLDAVVAHAQSEVALLRPARPPAKPKLRVVTA